MSYARNRLMRRIRTALVIALPGLAMLVWLCPVHAAVAVSVTAGIAFLAMALVPLVR